MSIIDKIEVLIWLLIISSIVYLLLPLTTFLLGESYIQIVSILCVLFVNVIYSFILNLVITKKYDFKWYFPVIIGLLFIPYSLILYSPTTVCFFALYIIVGLLASLICYKYKTS